MSQATNQATNKALSQVGAGVATGAPTAVPSRLIQGFGTLLGFLFAGEIVTRGLGLSVPGSIIGLLLLFVCLKARARLDLRMPDAIDDTGVAQVATPLLRNLAILFVAPGVGVVQYADLFVQHGLAVGLVLIATVLATLTVTALVFVAVQGLAPRITLSSWRIAPAPLDRAADHYLQTRERSR